VDFSLGGLVVLEGSHKHERLRQTYGRHDVDAFCENKPEKDGWRTSLDEGVGEEVGWRMGGSLDNDLNRIRTKLGLEGKWRTTEFASGDIVVFSSYTVHASIDNTSNRVRLSTDSRYQPLGTVLDERWIGANPVGHSLAGKRGRIC
jgi:ectoine hydroxylase-related dioxygenase (phytanoyl-CoA dioxygenase family)